jgi:hypothetical protein
MHTNKNNSYEHASVKASGPNYSPLFLLKDKCPYRQKLNGFKPGERGDHAVGLA